MKKEALAFQSFEAKSKKKKRPITAANFSQEY